MVKSLNGKWQLSFFEQNAYTINKPSDLLSYPITPISCTVPGNVELDLSEAGVLPKNLFMGMNILETEKFETYEWWYQTRFEKPKSDKNLPWTLLFEGVDCFAEYYLNDVHIGESKNMLIPVEFDVTDYLIDGENILSVRIKSAVLEENKIPTDLFVMNAGSRNKTIFTGVRKAACSYGWDIMPRAISAGIWRSVSLLQKTETRFEQLYVVTLFPNGSEAELKVMFELQLPQKTYHSKKQIKIAGQCGENRFEKIQDIEFKAGNFHIFVDNPKLWWPAGYGEPNLYDVTASLLIDDETVDIKTFKLGIRTLILDRSDITDGESGKFRFLINGVEIFAKGSNWVPLDVYHSRDCQRYAESLALVKDIGCNILRCWGGNVYEDDAFFDFCDKNGIMVWQDFAMACNTYPRSEEFCHQMKDEATQIIRKLRQHPSIVLWAGDNECDNSIACLYNPNEVQNVTRKILPDVVINNDYNRPYLPSSPFISEEVHKLHRFDMKPEEHLWGVRDYYKSPFYANTNAHFVSEIGYHGCPNVESIHKFITPEKIWPNVDNNEWILHSTDQKGNPRRVNLMRNQIKQMFGFIPDTLEEFSLLSQISQAEAKKFFVERMRMSRPQKSGIIWWNLIDGWPQMSDAVVDYYYSKKLAYYTIKNSQQPLCIFISEIHNGCHKVIMANDTLTETSGKYRVYDAETNETLQEDNFVIGQNTCQVLGIIPAFHSDQKLLMIEWQSDNSSGYNHYICGTPVFNTEQFKKWYKIIFPDIIK